MKLPKQVKMMIGILAVIGAVFLVADIKSKVVQQKLAEQELRTEKIINGFDRRQWCNSGDTGRYLFMFDEEVSNYVYLWEELHGDNLQKGHLGLGYRYEYVTSDSLGYEEIQFGINNSSPHIIGLREQDGERQLILYGMPEHDQLALFECTTALYGL